MTRDGTIRCCGNNTMDKHSDGFQKIDISAMETACNEAVQEAIARKKSKGLPVAYYDAERKKAYLEYPDGKREYME